jgi:hypothetical protein
VNTWSKWYSIVDVLKGHPSYIMTRAGKWFVHFRDGEHSQFTPNVSEYAMVMVMGNPAISVVTPNPGFGRGPNLEVAWPQCG